MIRAKRIVLVSRDASARKMLADYLGKAGFELDECAELALPTAYAAIVMVAKEDTAAEALESQVRSWMKLTKSQRVVIVTSKPAALRELLLAYATRLVVLAAPAFGWDVVDALRAIDSGPSPRGA